MASGIDPKVRSGFNKMRISDAEKSTDSQDRFYPLSMIVDKKTEMYVKFAKVLIIFQGPVTEKRRAVMKKLLPTFKYAVRIICDETFEDETSSRLADYKVDEFYRYFRSRTKKAMEEGYNLIVIDQSMSNMHQMKYYCFLAQKMQYLVLPYPPLVSGEGSRREIVMNQAAIFREFSGTTMPRPNYFKHLFCGWFLHDIDSAELREEASLYVQDCFNNILDFKELFLKICKPSDFKSVYNMVDQRQDLAFCAVKIHKSLLDTSYYMASEDFIKAYGKMSKLLVVGFVISPHTIAARVKLTYEQKKLWEMPDDLDEESEPTLFPSNMVESTKVNIPEESVKLISSKCRRSIITGEPIYEPTKAIGTKAKGRSCHILLGKVKDASLRNINYDVPFAISRETKLVDKYPEEMRPYDLDRCLVRRMGKYWIVYLKETLIVNGFFASCCSVDKTVN